MAYPEMNAEYLPRQICPHHYGFYYFIITVPFKSFV